MTKLPTIAIVLFLWPLAVCSQVKSPKKGIAFGYHTEADVAAISKRVSWWYNWNDIPDQEVAGVYKEYDMDFVPMAWNGSFNENRLREFLDEHPDVKFLLGFNEPNFKSQANMTPSQAAAIWPKLEAIADDYNLKLVSPAVNYCDVCVKEGEIVFTNPYEYLDAFFEACPDCRVDHIAVHSYMCYAGPLKGYIDRLKKYGRPIWLTEFACWDQQTITPDMQKSLMIGALDLLENDTSVFRYSWFNGDRSQEWPYIDLFEKTPGQLTELGELYLTYDARHDTTFYYGLPGRIEAEKYSRMSGVSLEGVEDLDGFANVGYIDPGDWMEYLVDAPVTGDYYVYFRLAGAANASLEIRENNQTMAALDIPSSGGWQKWMTRSAKIALEQGKHKLRVVSTGGNFNLNWLHISDRVNSPPKALAGEDRLILWPQDTVAIMGSGVDEDGDVLTYYWEFISGPSGFNISDPDSDSIMITGLQPGVYQFRLLAWDGIAAAYDPVRIEVQRITAIDKIEKPAMVYPNPVSDVLFIQKGSNVIGKAFLLDHAGRVLTRLQVPRNMDLIQMNLSGLERGLYFLRVETTRGNRIHKIIKM